MAAPDITALADMYGKTAVQAVGTSATAIVTNSAASGKALKINALYISSIVAITRWVTVDFYRSTTATHLVYRIGVPTGSTLTPILKDGPIYLEEGDSLRLHAEAATALEAVCSYEELA